MRTFGLVVEGVYDEAALTEFVRKCLEAEVEVIIRQSEDSARLMRRFPGFLEEFRYVKAGSNVDKAIVIRDADRRRPAELVKRMEGKISNRRYPFPVELLVVVEELEAWLLADEIAIEAVTRIRPQPVANPERLNDPKNRLRRVLSDASTAYTPEIARKIAATSRVDVLKARCPSFARFHEAVIDC